MHCEDVRDKLEELVDGLLPPEARPAVEEHVTACATCAASLRELRALVGVLAALPEPPVPSAFSQSVMQHLPEMLPARQGAGHVLRWGIAASIVLFGFLGGLAILFEDVGPDIAHRVLDPMAASLRLSELLLGHGATMGAAFLDGASAALLTADRSITLAFAAILVAANVALLAFLARYGSAESSITARRS